MQKKAIIDVQFNWIFIIIAGAVILLFFVSVINKQRVVSDNQISSTILLDLESILTGAKVSTGTVNIVDIPKKEIGFECNKYYIGGTNIQIRDKVLFSPDVIKGTELITWAVDWNVPFWVTNFLYITTKEVRYIVVAPYSDSFAQEIHNDWLPDEITKDPIIDPSQPNIQNNNNYRVKFIYVNTAPINSHLTNFPKEVVQAIKIDESSNKITFYRPVGNAWQTASTALAPNSFDYIGKAPLLGAIFSHDNIMYDCSMNTSSSSCKTPHSQAYQNYLPSIIADANSLISNTAFSSNIPAEITNLEQQNRVAQLYSCVLIY